MKDLELQIVDIQDVVRLVVDMIESGAGYTSSGRSLGNIINDTGRTYTLTLLATCDDEEFGFDESLPELDSEKFFLKGKAVIRAPRNYLPSSQPFNK